MERTKLPEFLQPLFWELDFNDLDWDTDRDMVVRRILHTGSWQAIRWLRENWGDQEITTWIKVHAGDHLSPRQLRYWEVALELPAFVVDDWVSQARNTLWESRVNP